MVNIDYVYMIVALTSGIWFPLSYYVGVHVIIFIIHKLYLLVYYGILVVKQARRPKTGIPIILELSLKECGMPFNIIVQ